MIRAALRRKTPEFIDDVPIPVLADLKFESGVPSGRTLKGRIIDYRA